jgi:hypothetical protein
MRKGWRGTRSKCQKCGGGLKLLSRRTISLLLSILIVLASVFLGCSAKSELPAQYTNDRDNFKKAVILLNEARDLSNPSGAEKQGSFELSKETEEKIFANTEEGIRLGKQVSDEYLEYLHPELRDMFKQKLIKGTEIWYEGIEDNNSGKVVTGLQKQVKGNELVIEWIKWWDKNGKSIADRVFGE